MTKKYDYAIYIGRFQPFHSGHQYILEEASKIAKNIIVLVGSINVAPTFKNPFNFEQRKKMIPKKINNINIKIFGIKDYINDNEWIKNIQNTIFQNIDKKDKICIVGCDKDSSTYYLKDNFIWDVITFPKKSEIHATSIRQTLFKYENINNIPIPTSTKKFLKTWISSKEFKQLKEEFNFIEEYKSMYSYLPFPPMFITTDAVVFCKGHVLLTKRKSLPGKDLWCLPGGFLNNDKYILDSCIDTLKKETKIKIDKYILKHFCMMSSKIFDDPNRSLRGRTVTHAYLFKINNKDLIDVKNSENIKWISFEDFFNNYETKMFEDHYFIVSYFYQKQGV